MTDALRYDTVTFLSDYGLDDEFVGIVESVLAQLAPGVRVVHLTHGIPPFDVRAGSLTLARSVQYVAPGVVLAVVDPGVGTDRRPVAVEIAEERAVLVGPDNGLLAAAVAMAGGAGRAVVLDNPAFHLEAPGATFDGRDVFAPVAAHLCTGVDLAELGTLIDPSGLMPGLMPLTRLEGDDLVAEVLWVDRFGNAQLNVDPDELDGWGDRVGIRVGDRSRTAVRVTSFADVPTGALGALVDSSGLIALVADRASAAEDLGAGVGDEVTLTRIDPGDDPGGAGSTPVAVTLGRRDTEGSD